MNACRIDDTRPMLQEEEGLYVATLTLKDRVEYHITSSIDGARPR